MSTVGQALGAVVGGAAGFFLGGGIQGAIYGAQIGMGIGGYIDPPKGPNQEGPRLADRSFQSSTYGSVIPRDYGTVGHFGNIVWLEGGQLREQENKTKQKAGKGGSEATITTYTYYATFALTLCEGPIVGVRRMWIGANLVYDAGSNDPVTVMASNASAEGWKLYRGTDPQSPDPRIEAEMGVGATPAWPGVAYIVFYDLNLSESYGNSLMAAQVKVEIVVDGTQPARFVQMTAATGWNPNRIDFAAVPFDKRIMIFGGSTNNTTSVYGDAWQSGDGVNWRQFASFPARYGGACCIYDDRIWYLGGSDYHAGLGGLLGDVISSKDGRYWISEYAPPWDPRYQPMACEHDGYLYFTGGLNGVTEYADLWRMDSTGLWELVNPDCVWRGSNQGRFGGNMISHGGYLFVMLGKGDAAWTGQRYQDVWRSADGGVTWTLMASNLVGSDLTKGLVDSSAVSIGKTLWVVAQMQNAGSTAFWVETWKSTDFGATWTNVTLSSAPTSRTNGVAVALNGSLVFVGGTSTSDVWVLQPSAATPGTTNLADIIQEECLRSKYLTTADIDITMLSAQVRGFSVNSAGTLRSVLTVLQGAYPFDVIQSGYKLKFVPRGNTSVATIAATDLDTQVFGTKHTDKLPMAREMETQLPAKVSVIFNDVNREYDSNEVFQERVTADAANEVRMTMPIVFTTTEARKAADVLITMYWLERTKVGPFSLPPTYRNLEAADVITIPYAGHSYQIRLTNVEYTLEGPVICSGRFADSNMYSSTVIGEDGTGPGATISLPGPTDLWLMDIPCLTSQSKSWGMQIGVSSLTPGWPGASILRSDDGGESYNMIDASQTSAEVFKVNAALAAARTDIPDASSVLTVTPISFGADLYSCTWLEQMNGSNLAALGAPGRWEIINFRTVTPSGGDFIIQDFGRGLFGTEWAMGLHTTDDVLIMLNFDAFSFESMAPESYMSERLWRAVTARTNLNAAADVASTYEGTNLKPLSPVYVGGKVDTTGNWIISWTRRTRFGGGWTNRIDAPLSETSEAYEIDILDATNTTVLRTLTSKSPTVTYTAANQITDFGSKTSTLNVKVYQMSSDVGRGYERAAALAYTADGSLNDSVVLAMHGNGTAGSATLTDEKGNTISVVGNTAISNTQSGFFGTGYIAFDGSGDYFYAATGSAWQLTGNFCIKFRTWLAATRIHCWLDTRTGNTSTGFFFGTDGNNKPQLYIQGAVITGANSLPLNTWKEICIERVGTVITIRVEGVSVGSATVSNSFTDGAMRFGTDYQGSPFLYGGMEEILIYKDRYVHNADYTPATAEFSV